MERTRPGGARTPGPKADGKGMERKGRDSIASFPPAAWSDGIRRTVRGVAGRERSAHVPLR